MGPIKYDLKRLLAAKAKDLGCEIVGLAIEPDHVRLVVNSPPSIAPDQIMFRLKGSSAHALRSKYAVIQKMPSMWTRSYFCSTSASVTAEVVKLFFEEQGTR